MKIKNKIPFLCMAMALCLLTGCASRSNQPAADDTMKEKADSSYALLSTFTADTLEGGVFTQDDIQSKDVTVINFWSTTCGPCIMEMPDLASYADALPDNVQLITVCLDGNKNEETAKSILQEAGFEGITLIRGDNDLITVCNAIRYTPTTIFVDSEGNIANGTIIGAQKNVFETLTAAINQVLTDEGKEEIRVEEK